MSKNVLIIGFMFCIFVFTGCRGCSSDSETDTSYLESGDGSSDYMDIDEEIAFQEDEKCIKIAYREMYGNIISVPVKINGMSLDMIFDTGASSTYITLAEAQYLYEKGSFSKGDIIDYQQFETADGKISIGLRIVLRSVSIGEKINLYNIEAVVVENQQAPLLLGQSVMKKFREISVDRENKIIKFFE